MPEATRTSRDAILSIVAGTLAAVAPNLRAAGAETALMGSQAVLDSVGFVTFLVSLEQNLDNAVDLVTTFTDQAQAAEQDHPFRTVGSLADHIHSRLAAQG